MKIKISIILIVLCATQIVGQINNTSSANSEIINIGSRLELFVDYYIIDSLDNVSLKLHEPIDKGSVLKFDKPWEGPFSAYCTVIKDGGLFRLYYRGGSLDGKNGSTKEYTCYAESKDGISWTKPNLKIYKISGTFNNNVVLANAARVMHNFSPFLDTRKNVNPKYKYKALGGLEKSGLIAYASF